MFDKCTGDRQTLTLSAGEVTSVLCNIKIKTTFFCFYNISCLCNIQCIPELLICCIRIAPVEIIADGAFEQNGFLRNDADSVAEIITAVIFYVFSIKKTEPAVAS